MSKSELVSEDEELLRRRLLEEALEVKSLRRIISAYLKYVHISIFIFHSFFGVVFVFNFCVRCLS